MDLAKYEKHKQLLLDERDALLSVAESNAESSKPVELDQSRVGRLSRMDAMQGQAMSKQTAQRRQLQLQRINSALRRIEEDDYGYCLRCGEEIACKRLDIDPAATLCVACAAQNEQV